MKRILSAVALLACVAVLTSCAHGPKKIKEPKAPKFKKVKVVKEKAWDPVEPPFVTGSLLDADVLAEGGDIGLVPFKAGSKAEATEELDKLSGHILRGIKESIDEQGKNLRVVNPEEAQPRLAMQGYIEEYTKNTKLSSRVMMKANLATFSVQGEVWLIANGQRLLSFSSDIKFDPKKQRISDVAYAVGKAIGEFIGSYVK